MEAIWYSRLKDNRGWLITLTAFLLVAILVWTGISSAKSRVTQAQADALYDALCSAAVNCYAIEGRYPTLEEIERDYSIAVNEEDFNIKYEQFASNIMPYISVEIRGAQEQ